MHRIAREPHRPIAQVDAQIPAAFDRILARALAKNPQERYQRAGEMANDLRNLRSLRPIGPGSAGVAEDDTQVLTRGPGAPGPSASHVTRTPSAADSSSAGLLADLDAFERRLEGEEQERLRVEEEETRRNEAEARRLEQAEARRREELERSPQIDEAQSRRAAAIEMLKRQAASRPPSVNDAARRAEAKRRIDRGLRSALHYLAEFALELNGAAPTIEQPYELIYLDRAPSMVLSNAFADFRARKLDGDDVCDFAFLKYQARYVTPAKADLSGTDIEHCRRFLDQHGIPFDFVATRKNDFGQPIRGTLILAGTIPCELFLRSDYDAPAVSIEMLNVGRLGSGRCRITPDQLTDDLVDGIGCYMLGSKSEFAKLVSRG